MDSENVSCGSVRFQGAAFRPVIVCCDGSRTEEQIAEHLSSAFPADVVRYVMATLCRYGCLTDSLADIDADPLLDNLRELPIIKSLRSVPGNVVRSSAFEASIACKRKTMARGKGLNDAQALLSCFAEAAERYCVVEGGIQDSNGCAAGFSIEEAAQRGLMELMERDAIAKWWTARLPRPEVNLATFQDAFLTAAAPRVTVLDLTTDWDVPVFAAIAPGKSGNALLGFGAHGDARTAITRAVLELNQIAGALEWSHGSLAARYDEHPQLSASGTLKTAADYAHLARRQIDYRVEEITRPEIGIPVVRVVADGPQSLRTLKDFPF